MSKDKLIPDTRILAQLLKYTKPYRFIFWTSAFLAIVLAPLNALTPYLANKMVDDHILSQDLAGLQKMALIFLLVLFSTTILRYYFILLTNTLGQNVIRDLRNKVFSHILSLRLSYFDRTPVGTNTTRTINDLESVNTVFSEGLITIIADVLGLIAILIAMFWTSVKLTLICLVSFPLLLIASYIFKEKVKTSFQRVRNEVARMNGFLQEHISGMRIVQIFTAEKWASEKFKKINKSYTQANLDGIFYYAVFFPVVEIISAASLGFMVWWGAQGVISQEVTVGQLIAFPMFLTRLFQPVRMLADKFNTLQMGLVAGGRILKILDLEEHEKDEHGADKSSLKGDIEFRHVGFSYNGHTEVIKNLSFILPAGKSLAIVGSTGSGKTTIISLLNRLYTLNSGNILIGGKDIESYDLKQLRKKIGFVLQDVFLFSGSVFENISLKDPSISLIQVKECAKDIGVHEYIEKLPGGYHYVLSERGSNLSMGQRQLISFVRAMVFDPEILVLDEATSSIDTETEFLIQQTIEKLIHGRTSITIAHRLSTIQNADVILVLDKGEAKEFGSQTELLHKEEGYYTRLHQTYLKNIETTFY
ncbi:MAG: ABC transporter ATP-binding protein/permease [Bacteroidota bacterium]|nr:ABC transporter ATP-binding protein/permease [Bacteroidota bacterium]